MKFAQTPLRGGPLFNVALLFQNFPAALPKLEGVQVERCAPRHRAALLDLRFIVENVGGGMNVTCEFSTSLFTRATASWLLRAYSTILEQFVAGGFEPGRIARGEQHVGAETEQLARDRAADAGAAAGDQGCFLHVRRVRG